MEYKFVFQAVPKQEELFRQVSQGLEKAHRDVLPGEIARALEGHRPPEPCAGGQSARLIRATELPAGDGTGGLAAGHFRTDPRRPEPQELGTLLAVGRRRSVWAPACSGYCSPGLWEC